ncbi:MAG: hypothetical protein ACK59M_00140 [Pseudomonadota bacterium]
MEIPVALFMSADVVGSTAYKTAAIDADGRALWLEAFDTLFRELPLIFIGQVAAAGIDYDHVPRCGVWKVLGDEIIFIGMPANRIEAELLSLAFIRTVAAYDRRIAGRTPLRIRGACWAAELGDRNRIVEIPEMFGGSDGRAYEDFLGPDVDIGFRLSPHSVPGRVIASPNLVESLAASGASSPLRFHLLGTRALKGVCGGHPFPLILLSCAREPFDGDAGMPVLPAAQAPDRVRQDLAALRRELRDTHGAVMAPAVFEPTGRFPGPPPD